MGWEVRNGRRYYYDAKKINGKVVKTYVGREQDGLAFSELSENARRYRDAETLLRLIERRQWLDVDTTIADFCERVGTLVITVLTEAGYHRHDRGNWRKRRTSRAGRADSRNERQEETGMATGQKQAGGETSDINRSPSEYLTTSAYENGDVTSEIEPSSMSDEELNDYINEIRREVEEKGIERTIADIAAFKEAAIERAENGDESARPVVRRILEGMNTDLNPAIFTQLADKTLDEVLRGCYGTNILAAEIARKEAHDYRKALLGPTESPLDKLLVDQVLICWSQANFHERIYASVMQKLTVDQHKIYQERVDRAQRRLLRATKTLAQVRKLQLPMPPSFQVNIASNGGQQINPAGGIVVSSRADLVSEPAPDDHVNVRCGTAVWRTAEADIPIEITGLFGEHEGRKYARIAGSGTGIPVDEVVYESAVAVRTPD